jgi:hypothetical protein
MTDPSEKGSFRSPAKPVAISIIGILRNYLDRDVRQTLRLTFFLEKDRRSYQDSFSIPQIPVRQTPSRYPNSGMDPHYFFFLCRQPIVPVGALNRG